MLPTAQAGWWYIPNSSQQNPVYEDMGRPVVGSYDNEETYRVEWRPRMFPMEVCEFQIPKMSPFLAWPNQFATTVTTPGQPVA